jgi:hypothetical protein
MIRRCRDAPTRKGGETIPEAYAIGCGDLLSDGAILRGEPANQDRGAAVLRRTARARAARRRK